MGEKEPYKVAPSDDEKVVDLSKPVSGDLRFQFIENTGKSSAIIKLVKPKGTRYEYDGQKVSHIKVSRSDLSTIFTKAGDLEYICTPSAFTDMLDEIRNGGKDVEVRKYRSDR